jgi:hypothetical protein
MTDEAQLPAFQRYQLGFTRHIRDPKGQPRPAQLQARRMRVYTEIVFNNLFGAVSACFPVAQQTLGKRAWLKLVRGFFAHHQAGSPLFRQIPEEFLRYLGTRDDLPPYLKSLAHYEWIELAIASADAEVDMAMVDAGGDLLTGVPAFVAAYALLSYDYPVHRISARHKPKDPLPQAVHFLVFRDTGDEVRFIELNPVTARLLELLQGGASTCKQALLGLAEDLAHPDPEAIVHFGSDILQDLKAQGAILGVHRQEKA